MVIQKFIYEINIKVVIKKFKANSCRQIIIK